MIKLSTNLALILPFAALIVFGQDVNKIKQISEKSSCSNIVALAGNVNLNCSSLTPEQEKLLKDIPIMLNKILSSRDTNLVINKLEELRKSIDKINSAPSMEHEYTNSDITALGGGTAVKLNGNAPVKFDKDRITADGRQANGQPTVGVDDNSSGGTTLSNGQAKVTVGEGSKGGAALMLEGPRSTYHGNAGFIMRSQSPPECRPHACIDIGKPISRMTLAELKRYGTYLLDNYAWLRNRCYPNELDDIYSSTVLQQYAEVQSEVHSRLPNIPLYSCLQVSTPPTCSWADASQQMRNLVDKLTP